MHKRNSLTFEISVILILKAIFIYAIWAICFSHPLDDSNPKMMSEAVKTHFFNQNIIKQGNST